MVFFILFFSDEKLESMHYWKILVFEQPSSLEEIGIYAFKRCKKLDPESINIPSSCKSIGQRAFDDCVIKIYIYSKEQNNPKKCNIY